MTRLLFTIHRTEHRPYALFELVISRVDDGQISQGQPVMFESVEEARAALPSGLDRVLPSHDDAPSIVETWV